MSTGISETAPSLRPFGLAVGHATDKAGGTGCTVIRGISLPFRASCAVLGRATGSRELALLDPGHQNDRVDAILLTGGSAYGLDSAAGVMRWMEREGRGFPIGPGVVPIVPAAVIFDLPYADRFDARPTADMAEAACAEAKSEGIAEGSVGVGTGATVGKIMGLAGAMKGGFAIAVEDRPECSAAAMVVLNAFGDVRDSKGDIIAGARSQDGSYAMTDQLLASGGPQRQFGRGAEGHNTTLAVVALSASFDKISLNRIAIAATAAYHRRIAPAGSSFDGDIIFAISPREGPSASLAQAEMLAVSALEAAIERAVLLSRTG